jgi:hypothetical protein
VHRRCPVAGGQELPTRWRRHSCSGRSRKGPLPEICQKLRYAQPRGGPTTLPSAAPLSCAVAWVREVLCGVVNLPRIDGKDGVAGSIPAGGSTYALTSGNAGRRRVR